MPNVLDPIKIIHQAFPDMTRAEADEIVAVGSIQAYPPGKVLCREGAFEQTFYVILDGEVRVTKFISENDDHFLCSMLAGEFFGEMALIHNSARAASVVTTLPTVVLEISKLHFDELVRRNSSVTVAMIREVSRRLRENNDLAIDDLRMKARELAQAYQQLAEMEYARSEFLTVIAHELRTPLTVANGFLQMIRTAQMQGDALNSALDTVTLNLQEIITLTNDILFLQEMDFILPDFQAVDLSQVVQASIEQQNLAADRSEATLSVQLPSTLPAVRGEPKSLQRAIAAILNNAIKFSPDGGEVTLTAGVEGGDVWLKIRDQGVGIPADALSHIFDRFFHIEQVQGHMFRGVGLGLSIARQVIEQHKGRIEVESAPGAGSAFTIYLNRL